MRLSDIDAFRKDLGLAERCEDCERDARECQYDQIYTRMDFCGWLDDAEIIDAVPVVRCKDCKYRIVNEHYGERGYLKLKAYCDLDTGDPFELGRCAEDDNWFCADGERRTDEAD